MGGIIPPISALNCIIMSRRKTKSCASRAFVKSQSQSRVRRFIDAPLWLVLYWIDLAISTSGFFIRRRLLRLRNDLLTFLDAPSGDLWYVSVTENKGKNHGKNKSSSR